MTAEEINFLNAPRPVYVSPQVRRAQRFAANLPRPHRPTNNPQSRHMQSVNAPAQNLNSLVIPFQLPPQQVSNS